MSQSATNLLRGHVQPERSGVATTGPTIKIGNKVIILETKDQHC